MLEINRNMRCIETLFYPCSVYSLLRINRNMRCIETKKVRKNQGMHY